jgi:hypothetical protein
MKETRLFRAVGVPPAMSAWREQRLASAIDVVTKLAGETPAVPVADVRCRLFEQYCLTYG